MTKVDHLKHFSQACQMLSTVFFKPLTLLYVTSQNVRHTIKFIAVPDQFETLCIVGLRGKLQVYCFSSISVKRM